MTAHRSLLLRSLPGTPGRLLLVASLAVALALPRPAAGQEEAGGADLAQQLSNPVASLVSIPVQFNWDQPVGLDDDSRLTVNVQPVIPISVGEDWNLILRWIMPFVSQPRLAEGSGPTFGMSDIVATAFFSPKEPGAFIWGAGPVMLLPATSDPLLGTGKWGVGPSAVILKQAGPVTFGGLANHIWSVAGDDFTGGAPRGDVNSTFLQPFVSYTTADAVTFSVNLEASANWEAEEAWTVPLNLGIAKVTRLGPFPFSIQGGAGFFLAAPGERPDWRLRISYTLLLPQG